MPAGRGGESGEVLISPKLGAFGPFRGGAFTGNGQQMQAARDNNVAVHATASMQTGIIVNDSLQIANFLVQKSDEHGKVRVFGWQSPRADQLDRGSV
jgi:hypothetical protein